MKKGLVTCITLAAGLLLMFVSIILFPARTEPVSEKPGTCFTSSDGEIFISGSGEKRVFMIKGVNIGTGWPGGQLKKNRPGREEYTGWLKDISMMNANTVRVHTLMPPEFYTALYEYNSSHRKKIYLLQGIEFPESLMNSEADINERRQREETEELAVKTVDAVHGAHIGMSADRRSLYIYDSDVSGYLIGYVMGSEWDDTFLEYVSKTSDDRKRFDGEYLSASEDARPFESYLASWGDSLISYEEDRYDEQHMVSFLNSGTSDPFTNDIKLSYSEIEQKIDMENIIPSEKNSCGLFASYSVFPYYPLFMQIGEYTGYKDETGRRNPYRAYLRELNRYHSYPVVAVEFGMSASRSTIQKDHWRGLSQGGMNEEEQAEGLALLYEDIIRSGCSGAAVYCWQDEWEQTDWNEAGLSDPERKSMWNNVQSVSHFGLMTFSAGRADDEIFLDGKLTEWETGDIVYRDGDLTLSLKYDCEGIRYMVDGLASGKNGRYINIALDTVPGTGEHAAGSVDFDRGMDFIIRIEENGDSGIYVRRDYDILPYSIFEVYNDYTTGGLKELRKKYGDSAEAFAADDDFVMVTRVDGNALNVMSDKVAVNSTGILEQGCTDPDSSIYDSNADLFIRGDTAEGRLPWQLLNFYDPSSCRVIAGLDEKEPLRGQKVRNIYAAAYSDGCRNKVCPGSFRLKGWDSPEFHERLRPAYYEMKDAYGEGERDDNR